MKRVYICLFIVLLAPLMLGMGSMTGNDSPDKIPVTEKKFDATFIDQMDVVTECTDVSIEGKTFVEGIKGKGTYTISFEQIKYIAFLSKEGKLKCSIFLKNNDNDELTLDKDYKVYGRTSSGTFQIDLSDLKKMVFSE